MTKTLHYLLKIRERLWIKYIKHTKTSSQLTVCSLRLIHSQNSKSSYKADGGYTGTLAMGTLSRLPPDRQGTYLWHPIPKNLSLLLPCLSPQIVQQNHRLDGQKKLRSPNTLSNNTATPERPSEKHVEKIGQVLTHGIFLDQRSYL